MAILKHKSWSRFACLSPILVLASCKAPDANVFEASRTLLPVPQNPPNKIPEALDGTLFVTPDTAQTGQLHAQDGNGDVLLFHIVSPPSKGQLSLDNLRTGTFTYTPDAGRTGTDRFYFRANDGLADSKTASITLTLGAPDTAPVAADLNPASFDEDTSEEITLAYTDVDGDAALSCALSNLNQLSVTEPCACDGDGLCTVEVQGSANYAGVASFTYTVHDGWAASNEALVTLLINPVNDAPVLSGLDVSASGQEDTAKVLSFQIEDVDSALDCATSLSLSSTNTALIPNANVVWAGTAPNCTATLTPLPNQHGSTDLTLTLSDGVLSDPHSLTLLMAQVGDDANSGSWTFDALSEGLYSFATSVLQFTGGVVELIATDQTDDDNTALGFGGGEGMGVVYGTLADGSSQGLKLGNGGGCNATTTNCAELDASWSPQWEGLIGYWKLNDNLNDSVGSHHGTFISTPAYSTLSKFPGKSLEVGQTTSTAVDLGQPVALNAPGDFSLSLWYRPNDIAGSLLHDIISKYPWRLMMVGTYSSCGDQDGNIYFTSTGATSFCGTTILQEDHWYHLALSYDHSETTLILYVNGELDSMSTNMSINADDSTSLYLGQRHDLAGCCGAHGNIDEVAIWDRLLSPEELSSIYSRQLSKHSGTFTSRVMDASQSGPWTNFWWDPTRPFFKPLTSNGLSENSTDYPLLVSDTLMEDIVGVWHLNESSGTSGAGSVADASGQGHHGTPVGTEFGRSGRFSKAGYFDGASHVELPNSSTLISGDSSFTISAWFNTRSLSSNATNNGARLFTLQRAANSSKAALGIMGDNINGVMACGTGCSLKATITGINLNDGQWHHLVSTYNATTNIITVYYDATHSASVNAGTVASSSAHVTSIGSLGGANSYFEGLIDEVALWSRPLSATEVEQLYQRGASRLKTQVRSCALPDCSDAPWQGPDGSPNSYFSESHSTSTPLTGAGNVLPSAPSMSLAEFTSPPADNRYFQYRAILEADSSDMDLGPELLSAHVAPTHFPAQDNAIVGENGVAFYQLENFSQTLGGGGCPEGVGYNLSVDKINWHYWTGFVWAPANGSAAQSNSSQSIHANVHSFGAQVGRGTVYIKAFLKSSGLSPCQLDAVQLSGKQ